MERPSGNFGKILRELRKGENMTQESFSKVLETDRSNIANYESGKRLPPLDSLVKIAEFFNVSLDYLVFGKKPSAVPDGGNDEIIRELMAENTSLMESQLKLQEELNNKNDMLEMQKDMIELMKKYTVVLESKLKNN